MQELAFHVRLGRDLFTFSQFGLVSKANVTYVASLLGLGASPNRSCWGVVITGQPEQVDNPWGITPFKKVIYCFSFVAMP